MTQRRPYPARRAGEQFQRVELLRELDFDEEVLEMLEEDVVVAARRRSIDPSTAVDGAINAMLDHLARVPWCRACMQTIGDCDCRVAMNGRSAVITQERCSACSQELLAPARGIPQIVVHKRYALSPAIVSRLHCVHPDAYIVLPW